MKSLRSLVGVSHRECAFPIAGKLPVKKSLKDAFECVKSGDHIFAQSIAPSPTPLLEGLCSHVAAKGLKKITLHQKLLKGPTPWLDAKYNKNIRANSFFAGSNLRQGIAEGLVDINSVFLHEVPMVFRRGVIKLNVALIHVSPPDANGYCSLGTSVDTARGAVTSAEYIIGKFVDHRIDGDIKIFVVFGFFCLFCVMFCFRFETYAVVNQ